MGSAGRVARLSVKTMVYFYVVSALALLLGLLAANLIPTGVGLNIDPRSIDTSSIAGYVKDFHNALRRHLRKLGLWIGTRIRARCRDEGSAESLTHQMRYRLLHKTPGIWHWEKLWKQCGFGALR
jgi:hypothetical protein